MSKSFKKHNRKYFDDDYEYQDNSNYHKNLKKDKWKDERRKQNRKNNRLDNDENDEYENYFR
jgi:hypothetical protein